MKTLMALLAAVGVSAAHGCGTSKGPSDEGTAQQGGASAARATGAATASPSSREQQALAFFAALQSGDPAKVSPFLLVPDDCRFMAEAMKRDNADPARCREGIAGLRAAIGRWLPGMAKLAQGATPTGTVKFEPIAEPGAPKWGYQVSIATTQGVGFPIAAFLLDGRYRFGIVMKKKAAPEGGAPPDLPRTKIEKR